MTIPDPLVVDEKLIIRPGDRKVLIDADNQELEIDGRDDPAVLQVLESILAACRFALRSYEANEHLPSTILELANHFPSRLKDELPLSFPR